MQSEDPNFPTSWPSLLSSLRPPLNLRQQAGHRLPPLKIRLSLRQADELFLANYSYGSVSRGQKSRHHLEIEGNGGFLDAHDLSLFDAMVFRSEEHTSELQSQ